MTSITSRATRPPPHSSRPIIIDVCRTEWTKFRSVRSTYLSLLAAAAAIVGLAALLCAAYLNGYSTQSAAAKAAFNPTAFSLNGLLLAQLAIGTLGALVMTSEYTTGMIRTTFSAVPQRRVVLAAKAAVLGSIVAVVGVVSSFAAFFIGQAILSAKHIEAHIGDPGVVRSIIGAGLYLAVLGLLALGLGALIRHSAGAIAAVFGILIVLPGIAMSLPMSWSNAIGKYLPSNAGQAIYTTIKDRSTLSPWAGFGLFCAYAAIALIAAAVVLVRRDA